MDVLTALKEAFISKMSCVPDMDALNQIRIEFLGKSGAISAEMKKLGSLNQEIRKEFGSSVNLVRDFIAQEIESKQQSLNLEALKYKLKTESIDITIPGRSSEQGKTHPITHTIAEIRSIFAKMGFAAVEGPEIEDDWHNFTGLNVAELHPARQMHDTFYIANEDGDRNLLLRTHTSSVQIRHMASHKPPVRILSIGKVYRSDFDATHTPMFHQIEGLCIDEHVNLGHLKWCISEFLKSYFGLESVPMRFRSSYFPFTEPSIEVDIQCDRSNRDEIKIGRGSDWMEIMGCGMVHNNVLQNMNVDLAKYQGFAFGMGVERMAMLKYGISDLRRFFDGDMRHVMAYGF